jgi:hypothetical protein
MHRHVCHALVDAKPESGEDTSTFSMRYSHSDDFV